MSMGIQLMAEFRRLLTEQSEENDDIVVVVDGQLRDLNKNAVCVASVRTTVDYKNKSLIYCFVEPGCFSAFPGGITVKAYVKDVHSGEGRMEVNIANEGAAEHEFSDGICAALKNAVGY